MAAAVVIVINRRARYLERENDPLLIELRRSGPLECVETSTLEELAAASIAIATKKPDGAPPHVVVLAGGDGSHMAGISALTHAFGERSLPAIALAPGGTVCTVARNWGMPWRDRDVAEYMHRLLDSVRAPTTATTRRPTLRVSCGDQSRVGFIFGAGLVARFFDVYERGAEKGYGAAARIVAKIFAGSFVGSRFARSILDPSPCDIEIDGVRASFDRISLLCASVVRDLGLSMKLLYRAAEENDRFHIVATPLGARSLGPQMPLVIAGRPLVGQRVDALARKVVLRFPAALGAYVLDGDLFHDDEITISAGPVLDIVTASQSQRSR